MDEVDVTPQIWYKFRGQELVDADREYVVLIRQIGHYLNELEEMTRQKSVQWKFLFETIRTNVDMQAPLREQGKAAARIFRQSTSLAHGARGSGEVLRGMLRALGVLVVETPIKESRIEGCSFHVGAASAPRPCVFANTHHATWFRRNIVLMHEIGHAIFEPFTGASLDFVGGIASEDVVEVRAQAFAKEVLIPKEVLFHIAQSNGIKWNALNPDALARLVAHAHVELKTLVDVAIDSGYLSVEQGADLKCVDIASRLHELSDHALSTEEYLEKIGVDGINWIGKRSTTTVPRTIRLPVGYVNVVVEAYTNHQISPGKAAEYLMIDETEFLGRFGDIYEEVEY
jgi:Zn-dependent peptidase ImmA (M78 family)